MFKITENEIRKKAKQYVRKKRKESGMDTTKEITEEDIKTHWSKAKKRVFANKLGKQLKEFRTMRGLTLKELAGKVSYTTGYIGLLEQGKSVPNTYILHELAKALNVPMSALFGEKEAIESVRGLKDPMLSKPENKEYLEIMKTAIMEDIKPEQIKSTLDFLKQNV